MHLTLAFLGEVPRSRLEEILEALGRKEASPVGPFRLAARGIGTFPQGGRPRVIWAGIVGDLGAAERLKKALDAALEPLGFRDEERGFRPHLTLGRLSEGRAQEDWRSILEPLAGREFGSFEVGASALYESRLLPQGAQYSVLRRFPLDATVAAG